MNKIKTKLQSLPKERLYLFFIGIIIIFGGVIGAFAPWFSALFGIILGPFCILVGYYGSDVKKGVNELKGDMEGMKDMATSSMQKTVAVAKDSAAKVEDAAKKTVAKPATTAKKPAAKK